MSSLKNVKNLLKRTWVFVGAIIASFIGSAIWSYFQNGSLKLSEFLTTSTKIPVSTLLLSIILLIFFIDLFVKSKTRESEKTNEVIRLNKMLLQETKKNEGKVSLFQSDINRLQNELNEYKAVENVILAIIEEKQHATIKEINKAIQSMKSSITSDKVLDAIGNLKDKKKIRGYALDGFRKY